MTDLTKFLNKYVDISWGDDEGASGWVVEATETKVVLDYGYGFTSDMDFKIKEVEPPLGDPGMFKPDEG